MGREEGRVAGVARPMGQMVRNVAVGGVELRGLAAARRVEYTVGVGLVSGGQITRGESGWSKPKCPGYRGGIARGAIAHGRTLASGQ